MLKRPLKAPNTSVEDEELNQLPYPLLGSPKIDGFRCLIDEIPKTSSMKPMPNPYVMEILSRREFNGLDGELVIGKPNSPDTFNNSTGELRRQYGEPDFTFYIFDSFLKPNEPYLTRWFSVEKSQYFHPRISVLPQTVLHSPEEVVAFTNQCIEDNFEGAMLRTLSGKYKQGRATFKEMNIFKRKPLADTEATIIGFVEQMTNLNPQVEDELGLMKRASNQDGKVGAGTLGSFILKSPLWADVFNCGGGTLSHAERQVIWNNRKEVLGKKVTFKYQQYGSINAPRQPIFRRFYNEL
jgi:DNA ligase 1